MNRLSRDYKIYKTLLGTNLAPQHRDAIMMNEGFKDAIGSIFGKIKSLFGGDAEELGPGIEVLAKNPDFAKSVEGLKKPIGDAINQITDIAKKMNIPDPKGAAAAIIMQVLNDEGVSQEDIANPKPIEAPGEKGESETSGTKIDPNKPETAVPTIVTGAAEATGNDAEKAKEKAADSKVTPEKATSVLSKAIASKANVDVKAADAVVKALISTGHLLAEGHRRLQLSDVKKAINEVKAIRLHESVLNRWSSLAGLNKKYKNVILEANTPAEEFIEDLQKGNIKDLDGLSGAIRNVAGDSSQLENLKSNFKELEAAYKKAGGKNPEKFAETFETAIAKKPTKKSEEASPEDKKKAEEAKKKYSSAFQDVKKKVGDAADDLTIGKVLTALDELESLQVK